MHSYLSVQIDFTNPKGSLLFTLHYVLIHTISNPANWGLSSHVQAMRMIPTMHASPIYKQLVKYQTSVSNKNYTLCIHDTMKRHLERLLHSAMCDTILVILLLSKQWPKQMRHCGSRGYREDDTFKGPTSWRYFVWITCEGRSIYPTWQWMRPGTFSSYDTVQAFLRLLFICLGHLHLFLFSY